MPDPVLSVEAMRAREMRTWASGIQPETVIRRAGIAVAEVARGMAKPGAPVLVLSGRGHNGDDAEVAAGALGEDRDTLSLRLRDPISFGRAHEWLQAHAGNDDALVVDGLFGIGLNRAIDGDWAGLVAEVNRSGIPVLAVDVPSGLNADTGEPMGVAIEARCTVTLGSVKRGLIEERAAPYVGRLELAHDIGLVAAGNDSGIYWSHAGDFRHFPPRRGLSGHKGMFGHVAVVAGTPGYHGAAVLAARGALRARPGLVTVVTDERCYVPVASQLQSAMVRVWGGEPLDGSGVTAVVMGPGLASASLSPAWRAEMHRVWSEAECPVVADASVLDALPAGRVRSGIRVVTPHPGEAGRLLRLTAGEVQADRLGALGLLQQRWAGSDIWVVLKGRHTLIGGPDGTIRVNSSGNPGLAQGGSGDVLAGYLGGLLAQPTLRAAAGTAVGYGVWRHGWAADQLERQGTAWTVEELVGALGWAGSG